MMRWLSGMVLVAVLAGVVGCGAAEHDIQKLPPDEEAKKMEEMRQHYKQMSEEMQKQARKGGGPGGPPGR